MDLTKLVTQDNADSGVWFQLEVYGDKQDVDLLIYGNDSDIVKKFERKRIKDIMKNKRGNRNLDDEAIEETLNTEVEAALVRLGDIRTHSKNDEPVTIGDKVITSNKDDLRYLIEKIPEIKEFVTAKSNERTNFLSATKKNSKKQ